MCAVSVQKDGLIFASDYYQMKIGITYDLRDDYKAAGFTDEETAEFDSVETIAAIDATLQELLKEGDKPEAVSLVYFKLAKVNMKLAHWGQATDYLEKIVRSFPNSLEVPAAKQLLEEKRYFAVQVGAFMERRLAEALVDELKQKEEYAYIIESLDSQDRKFYRVRVGQLAMLKDAQALKNRLAKFGYPAQIYP